MASTEEMLEQLFSRGINDGDDSVFDDVLHENYTNHSFGAEGRDAMRGVIANFRNVFPDMQIAVDERLVDGDRAAQRGHFTGTHHGEIAGIPATGKKVTIQWQDWWVVRDGMLADNWVVMDFSPLAG